eukprot:SAG11_NODE_1817_length_4215_cov_1.788630_2_plen_68_part_00
MDQYHELADEVNAALDAKRVQWKNVVNVKRQKQRDLIGKLCAVGDRSNKFAMWVRENAVLWTVSNRL